MNVFVHVAYGFGAENWHKKYINGQLVGCNDAYAYGYYLAQALGCRVTYSTDHSYNFLQMLVRGALRLLLGFDILHAYRNRGEWKKADVIWTHTESQHLSILCLCMLFNIKRPKMICQSVWLMDEFNRLSPLHKWLYLRLLKQADVLTFLSEWNRDACRKLLPDKDVRMVHFGINPDGFGVLNSGVPAKERRKIMAVGNDRHRDWNALIAQFSNTDFDVRIVSTRVSKRDLPSNINISPVSRQADLIEAYMEADIAIVPLKHNLHASGITAIFEANLFEKPLIVTDIGGIDGYFSNDEVYFAEHASNTSLYDSAVHIRQNRDEATGKAKRAAQRTRADYSSQAYVAAHVALSHELLNKNRL
ncbi:glycosyltransferase family 4 protein [Asticcacaulis tiandongensis]|uniref:glycosyltransferase family 4 protein n=1 Tax=Asticcacaulis tiandongensis TaxID=2565365 RepID=UPI00112C0913|nr:glycosyltransferase family 4 protein [Asticcacaulis tiandongensis]